MNCSNIIEEDILSQLSKDSSIDYEEQNNIEASFDYNSIYEEEFSGDEEEYEDDEDEEVLEDIDKEISCISLNGNKLKEGNTKKIVIEECKPILKESRRDLRKQVEEINDKQPLRSQSQQVFVERFQKQHDAPENQNPLLLQQNVKSGLKDIKEEEDEQKSQSRQQNQAINNKRGIQQNVDNQQILQNNQVQIGQNSTSSIPSIQDFQSSRNNTSIYNLKSSFNSSNTTNSTSSKQKSVITFQLNRNENKMSMDSLKRKQKSQGSDFPSVKLGESFRVLLSPRDGKNLPNIDKIKAKFTKLKQKPPNISSKSWVIINGKNKKLISGNNENQVREIASLTKMMTCYIVVNYVRKLNLLPEKTYFRVSGHAANQPGTSAELCEGELVNIIDLLYGMMLPSGNDAAFVLAENFGVYLYMQSDKFKEKHGNGEIKKKLKVKNPITYFIKEMNTFAEKLNMQDTYFTNPHGLMHKKNKSTSYDIGLLAYQLIHDPLIRTIISAQNHRASILTELQQPKNPPIIWKNTNKLLKKSGFLGLKTGITLMAGPCLASWYKNEHVNLIIILLGAKSTDDRWTETQQLVEWAKKQLQPKKKQSDSNNNNSSNNN